MSARHVRLRAERKVRVLGIRRARARVATNQKRIKAIDAWLKAHPEVPGIDNGWMKGVPRTQTGHGFAYRADGGNKMVWHTTEGSSIPNYQLGWPHFTLDLKRKRLEQHIPIGLAAQTLKNASGGADTNATKYTIQCEIVGFARESGSWTDAEYAQIAALARWVEVYANVPRKCSVTFRSDANHKIQNWHAYEGHCGHQHVPENDHWDPGEMKIGKVI